MYQHAVNICTHWYRTNLYHDHVHSKLTKVEGLAKILDYSQSWAFLINKEAKDCTLDKLFCFFWGGGGHIDIQI